MQSVTSTTRCVGSAIRCNGSPSARSLILKRRAKLVFITASHRPFRHLAADRIDGLAEGGLSQKLGSLDLNRHFAEFYISVWRHILSFLAESAGSIIPESGRL